MRLLAFDIDYTLSAANEPIAESTVGLLKRFEERGIRLFFLSGKTVGYVSGVGRQLGLQELLCAGENGAAIIASHRFPPAWERIEQPSEKTRTLLDGFIERARQRFGERIWFQPNIVNVSIFWRDASDKDEVTGFCRDFVRDQEPEAVRIYEHIDAVEITVPDADKGTALAWVLDKLGLAAEDAVAVGDSSNDVPMFEVAGLSLGIDFDQGDRSFPEIDSALQWLLART